MQVVYRGPHPEVVVDDWGEDVIFNGVPVEIPDEIAKSLLDQDTWTKAKAPASKPKGDS